MSETESHNVDNITMTLFSNRIIINFDLTHWRQMVNIILNNSLTSKGNIDGNADKVNIDGSADKANTLVD
jgi:hypothetical protein